MRRVDRVRLETGAAALALPEPTTIAEARVQLEQLEDGIVAMQSVGDLDSREENTKAWKTLEELERRQRALRDKLRNWPVEEMVS